MNDEELGPE